MKTRCFHAITFREIYGAVESIILHYDFLLMNQHFVGVLFNASYTTSEITWGSSIDSLDMYVLLED